MEGLPLPTWVGILGSGWLLASITVYLLIRGYTSGRTVPRSTLDDVIHDRNEWRSESRIKDSQIAGKDAQLAEKDRQLEYMAEVGETMKAVLTSVQRIADRERP